ncbi:MAG: hypothetical protein AAGG44_20670, partial [Planctomycetota bacterium]
MSNTKVSADRQILVSAQKRGGIAIPFAFARLSGPGWLQSAITLGGGSLTGALFLGVLGGTSMLWLQLIAIIMGVVMLSAISYVTLSTGKRPFQAINEYVNPVLGCGWLLATSAANMIWCMPQFSLSFDALDKNLFPGGLLPQDADDTQIFQTKMVVSVILFVAAFVLVVFNERRGLTARIFDLFLKALVGMIVVCFFGVVIYLVREHGLPWKEILSGFIPNLNQWNEPTGEVAEIVTAAPESLQSFWTNFIVSNQRDVMIGAAATAVGINMTFLLPYSMLARGWDKPFRGLARFDLATGMAIPYVLVTSCVVIAAAFSFHGKVDEAFLSSDPNVMSTSSIYGGASDVFAKRFAHELGTEQWSTMSEEEQTKEEANKTKIIATLGAAAWSEISEDDQAQMIADLPTSEKKLAATLVKRNAFQLSQSLEPLLGVKWA